MGKWTRKLAAWTLSASLVGTAFLPAPSIASASSTDRYVKDLVANKFKTLKSKISEKQEVSPYSKDTLVIKYDKPLSASDHKKAGTSIVRSISSLNYVVVKLNNKTKMEQALKAYQANNKVLSVSPSANLVSYSTNDPKVDKQYHLSQLNIEKAQKLAGNKGIKVAVIDTGIYGGNPELSGQLLPGYNVPDSMSQPYAEDHGTHVAGIIAAKKNNGVGGYGINPNAKIIPIDVFSRDVGASEYYVAEAILYAVKQGAKVINMSLGTTVPTPLIEEAVKAAIKKNVTVVAAAGNEAWDLPSYPAAIEGVISVGSTNKDKQLSAYSNYGPSVDVVAPGEDVYSTIYEYERKTSFRNMSGTSMASPVVAGVASLLLTKYPTLTPEKVEYILEHTSTDLGSKGFDTKFANGLINPVAALSFNPKKIPASVTNPNTEKDILAAAKEIQVTTNYQYDGKITKANEIQWKKFEVKKGEYIQTTLSGAEQFDYQMKIHLYSSDAKQEYTVNSTSAGKTEGKLLKVPFDGTLAIGVKDSNGSFDDTSRALSKYKLSIQKVSELNDDGNTLETLTNIDAFPYSSGDNVLTFTGDEGDEDYFKVKVEEPKILQVATTGVPGIDTSIFVYPAEMLIPPAPPADGTGEALPPGFAMPAPEPMFVGNSKGAGEGETLSFEAVPGMEYVIEVTNKVIPYYSSSITTTNLIAEPSAIPYQVTVDGRTTLDDEDGLPMRGDIPAELLLEGKMDIATYAKQKIEQRAQDPSDNWVDLQKNEIEMIRSMARPYEIGTKGEGFLQNFDDQDYFKLTPSNSGILEINLGQLKDIPQVEVYKVSEYEEEDGTKYPALDQIAYNFDFLSMTGQLKSKLYAGLKKGEEYYIKISSNYMSLSIDNYSFTSKVIISNPQDKYEDNDTVAKNLPSSSITANLAMPFDSDLYYYTAKANGTVGVTLERTALSKTNAAKYPKELQQNLHLIGMVIEDTNRNRKIDLKESEKVYYIVHGFEYGDSSGSFQAKKGKSYIVLATGLTEYLDPISLNPYKLSVKPANVKDEDAKSVVKNNKPSKPLSLKKVSSRAYEASGYFNAGVAYGDKDWYKLNLSKTTKGKITLTHSKEIDGAISLYNKDGKLLKTVNYYPEGDNETLFFNLKKGTYYIKVQDSHGDASMNPYKVRVSW
ncbi:S8 family serine peptidase [Bacillus massilinigeriensis]|uniref:S8 family serine peptidase n=1 Tax=Bacillus massilionigeriensis TaxID=1805475 RepID=UPI00096AE9D1|nr:S8 family serine peptidase [Bacillus massilionigeriensis]